MSNTCLRFSTPTTAEEFRFNEDKRCCWNEVLWWENVHNSEWKYYQHRGSTNSVSGRGLIKVPGICEMTMDGSHTHIYATDTRLIKLDRNGTIITSTGVRGKRPGQFNFPNGIWLSKDNEVYVCDSFNHRIQVHVFSEDLKLIRILGTKGSANGCLWWSHWFRFWWQWGYNMLWSSAIAVFRC